ncbi:ribonuclease M5 [Anaerorhabdus furcosa]|uniref:Ribonuclease M5 n=1 Tax=Anaerorhabdus furcosa TaxID=118967 RepID=A0A1T4MS80_9FIRM|nr:ribonuclease M5 [Anaerorhabdus furcosa]
MKLVIKLKIKEVIVVEGKNDTNVLQSYFECDTIETHGTHLSEKTLELIAQVNQSRGVIIFTDPDYPGTMIRNKINEKVKGCKNAFIDKEKSKTTKKVGVEHANKKDLEEALSNCVTFDEEKTSDLTISDLLEYGLISTSESKIRRKKVTDYLKVGESNAKTLYKRLILLGYTRCQFEELMKNLFG